MKFHKTNALSVFSEIKKQHKQIKLKRRFLLGCIQHTKSERRKLKKSNFFQKDFLPESLIREDDLFYVTVRDHVESTFGASGVVIDDDLPQDVHLIHMPEVKLKRLILLSLDRLSTKGLYLLAMIVTDGSVKYEKTRHNLKQIIKGSLSNVLGSKSLNPRQLESRKQICHLLSDPQHSRYGGETFPVLRSESCHAAVVKVLHQLRSFPTQTLIAMHNKLNGVKACSRQLQPRKHGWGRDKLIERVYKISNEKLLQHDSEDDLQESLAKAMAVADLSLKLTGRPKTFAREFYQFPPEIKSLQTNIMNAIWSVQNVVTIPVLRNLQLLIEPEAKISNKSLRKAFINLLTKFLFDSVDMDSIPKTLSPIIAVIHKTSKSTDNIVLNSKYIDKEVDYILGMSAQTKQIVLDLLPDHAFDQDFTDAYVEELDESDDSDSGTDNDDYDKLQKDRIDSNYESESIGDYTPDLFQSSTPIKEEDDSFCPPTTSGRFCSSSPDREYTENIVNKPALHESGTDRDTRDASCMSCEETEPMASNNSIGRNQYLSIQDACDKTSMLAYNLVGCLLREFAITEGHDLNVNKRLYLNGGNPIEDVQETEQSSYRNTESSTVIRVVKELVPSFSDSAMEKLKKILMS